MWLAETSQQPISQTTWLKATPRCNQCNHTVFMGLLRIPFTGTSKNAHMLSHVVDYQNYRTHKEQVVNKTGTSSIHNGIHVHKL
jgi:hypothetical protein